MVNVPHRLRFMKTRDGYRSYVSKELNAWPIYTKVRHNGTWKATIYRNEAPEVVFQEIGLTRQGVAMEAARWLVDNAHNLYMVDICTVIETKAVSDMIVADENDMLSVWMGKDAHVVRDDYGNFLGLSVEQTLNIEIGDEDYEDEDE